VNGKTSSEKSLSWSPQQKLEKLGPQQQEVLAGEVCLKFEKL